MKDNNEQPNFDSSTFTRTKNLFEAIRNGVNGDYSTEFSYANCGCCKRSTPDIKDVWSQDTYQFLGSQYTPDSSYDHNGHLRVHPTLWNNGTNNLLSGVFEVIPDIIYQVRGYDMANITFVRCGVKKNKDDTFPPIDQNSNWIVMDTLMSNECTEDALKCFEDYLKYRCGGYTLDGKIKGIIISHSHIDHYGGVDAVLRYPNHFDDDKKKDIPIYVPKGFYEAAVSENVFVGNAMGRRASYQYGSFIKPKRNGTISNIDNYTIGSISIGIGQGQSTGSPSAVPYKYTEIISNESIEIGGTNVECQLTPGTEAPAEMNNYFPDYNALWLAENCTGTLHNLYTLRGAQVRDAKAWAGFLMEAAYSYGDKTDVIFQSHNWPHWSSKYAQKLDVKAVGIRDFLIDTAAIYKYIHDQTLLYMNMGYKMDEVSDMLTLPRAMQKNWCLKPFYGTPKHNSKAVYQKYLGWYDANPLHLEELPPEQLAKEMLRYMQAGSEKKVLDMIRQDITNGNYWTAAYMAHQIILSDSNNLDTAKQLCADAMQQLGYQCESGTWRNAYLSAAYELRNGKISNFKKSADSLGNMSSEMCLDYISIFFDGERAATQLNYNGYLTVKEEKVDDDKEKEERFMFVVRNGAILYYQLQEDAKVNSQSDIVIPKSAFDDIIKGKYSADNILYKISKALVNINCYRFKQFDIVGRHDKEVYFNNKNVDLKVEVKCCIEMLEPYTEKFGNNTAIYLSDDDKVKWQTYYYPLLKTETQVLLESDFFKPQDITQGIGSDGYFQAYELYYTLYSLYRYLYSGYLKNDYDFKGNNFDQESFVKLKKSIVLLESYVADCYLKTANAIVEFDEQDSNAFHYLNNESVDNSILKLNETDFFFELYKNYKGLAGEIQSSSQNLAFVNASSDKYITVYNKSLSLLRVNNKVLENSSTDYVKIDISKMGNTIVIESFDKGSPNGNKLFTGRLIFHKPEISRNIPQVCQTNVSMPNPFINFYTKYTSKLFIDGKEQDDVEKGSCLVDQTISVKAVSSFGFYVESTIH